MERGSSFETHAKEKERECLTNGLHKDTIQSLRRRRTTISVLSIRRLKRGKKMEASAEFQSPNAKRGMADYLKN